MSLDCSDPRWAGRSVFVTGAGGFVGAWLASALAQRGARVVVLLRDRKVTAPFVLLGLEKKVDAVFGDVRDGLLMARVLATYDVESVFHLASEPLVGPAEKAPSSVFDSNVRGTWMLLEACRTVGVKSIVVASSDKSYGDHSGSPYEESFALRPRFPYEASKACADLIAQTFARTYGMPIGITRCANIYGGADVNWSRIVPGTMRAVLNDERPVLRSDGSLERDYLYIDDAVSGYLDLAALVAVRPELRGEAFNFGTGTPYSVLEVANRIIRISGKVGLSPDVRGAGKPIHEIQRQCVTSRKARELLQWEARVGLDEGLTRSLAWYRGHLASGPSAGASNGPMAGANLDHRMK